MNIEILTLSEVVEVAGQAGNFNVTVKKNPRYIDMDKCIACGICEEKCPKKVDDEFNMGLAKRKAAYIQYGQTVPLKYVIDPINCIYLAGLEKGKKKCLACEKFCPTGAINFEDKEEMRHFNVGSIILSSGYKPFDPSGLDYYGYGYIPDVVTSLEYERMLSASGPTRGHLRKPSDGGKPRSVAWIQCVGSRNINRADNGYCSAVCCMYAIKQALITEVHTKGGGEQTIFAMDVRSNGKEFEHYYKYAMDRDVRFIRARPHTVEPGPDNAGVTMRYFTEDGRQMTEDFDMAVLSIGMEATSEAKALAEKTGIALSDYNFAVTSCFNPSSTTRDGIFVGGSINRPMNIPTAVAMASSAAAEATRHLVSVKNTLTKQKEYPPERDVVGEEPRIGVFVCSCGVNIASIIDTSSLVEYAKTLPNVEFVENNLFSCSTDTQTMMSKTIRNKNLNRIVIAACSPRTHEPLFQDTLKETGLNGYLVEMANIRNHNAWVHQSDPEKATQKAKDQLKMAVAKVRMAYPLQKFQVDVIQKALVIGGGLAGINAALGLADQGYETVLLEKTDRLGGNALTLRKTARGENVGFMLRKLVRQVEEHDKIELLTDASLLSAEGVVGAFTSDVRVNGEVRTIQYGAAVLATGGKESVPTEYLYGQDPRVMTHMDFEKELTYNSDAIRKAKSMVFIQCVGSREVDRFYCSRICCTHSVKAAVELKELNPEMKVYVLYRDIRTYGINEDYYKKARELGVLFIRYEEENKPEVYREGDDLLVRVNDPIIGRPVVIDVDYLVLAAAVEANEVDDLVKLFRCATNQDGFLNEAHPKLRPVDMSVDGLFVAGIGSFPKTVEESISQAMAAVSRAGVLLSREKMHLDAVKSFVTEECDGCAVCVDVCPYDAIMLREESVNGHVVKKISTEEALCKGCGLCEASCAKEGIQVHSFTNEQIRAQLYAALDLPN